MSNFKSMAHSVGIVNTVFDISGLSLFSQKLCVGLKYLTMFGC